MFSVVPPHSLSSNLPLLLAALIFGAMFMYTFLVSCNRKKARAVANPSFPQAANKGQRGITGLETAIVLIAFVMVASVFAYVVLSSGMYSSQKAKESVNAGLQQARSTMQLKGDVIAEMEDEVATHIIFTLGLVPGGEGIDMRDTTDGDNRVIISYSDQYQTCSAMDWTVTKLVGGDDFMLDEGYLFEIDVDLAKVNDVAEAGQEVGAYTKFVLEVKPPVGAVLTIERTMPARTSPLVHLY